MIKILILDYPQLSNVGYWRLFRPLQVMRTLYPGVFQITFKREKITYSDIAESDIIITRRPYSNDGDVLLKVLKKANSMGIPVIFDEDDAVMMCPDTHELYTVYRRKEARELYVECLKQARAFWFSTPPFLQSISPEGIVIPNAILPSDLPDEPAPDMGLIGWQGKSIQAHDLVLGGWDWYEENKAKAKMWLFFGWKPPLRHLQNTDIIDYIEDTDTYMTSFRQNKINAMWKPLIDCPFNDHKSNINLLGATMAGGYTITNYAGKPGWEYASKEILPYGEACELWAKAKADILENYNLIKTAQQRAESILSLLPQFRAVLGEKEVA